MAKYGDLLLEEALRAANGDRDQAARMLGLKDDKPSKFLSYHDLMEQYSRFLLVETLWNAKGNVLKAAERSHSLQKPTSVDCLGKKVFRGMKTFKGFVNAA